MEKLEDNLCKILSGYNSLKFVSTMGEDTSPAGVSPILYHGSYITCTISTSSVFSSRFCICPF